MNQNVNTVKTTSGLVDVSADKVKNFADLAAVCAAIANGDLAENEWWSTVSPVQASGDDLAVQVARIESFIPDDTNSTDNMLVNEACLAGLAGGTVCSVNGCTPDANGAVTIPVGTGTVNSVNGCSPDVNGAVTIPVGTSCVGTVTSVNGCAPDASGNVSLTITGGYDIPVTSGGFAKCTLDATHCTLALGNGAFANMSYSSGTLTITLF